MGQGLILVRNRRRACRGGPDGRLTGWRTPCGAALHRRRTRARTNRPRAGFPGPDRWPAVPGVDGAPRRCAERHMKERRVKRAPQIFHDRAVSSSRSRNWSTSPASLAVIDT
ncbi:TPA: hypothetical protein QDE50_05710 [Burkholderia cenocepacia]|nr:hypothetical protein [Burkholderia cenocepacia]HDR9883641.1 hypothetical protein [Burkholderia cenocepacia]